LRFACNNNDLAASAADGVCTRAGSDVHASSGSYPGSGRVTGRQEQRAAATSVSRADKQ
jgi:hypothetical protein